MDETILGMQARKRETIKSAVGEGTAHPGYDEDGSIDEEMLELTRLDDISDEESEASGGVDDDSSSDSGSDCTDDSSDDEGEDEDDDDYKGTSETDATVERVTRHKKRTGTPGKTEGEESENDGDRDTEDK